MQFCYRMAIIYANQGWAVVSFVLWFGALVYGCVQTVQRRRQSPRSRRKLILPLFLSCSFATRLGWVAATGFSEPSDHQFLNTVINRLALMLFFTACACKSSALLRLR
mgnify:CR=1 FL=1